jgi:integrase
MSFKLFKSVLRRVMLGDGPLNRKEPLTSVHLLKILTKISGLSEQEREFLLLCSLCYYGFLRIGEAPSLTAGDIVFFNGIVSVTVRKSKIDETGRGETVPITDNGFLKPREKIGKVRSNYTVESYKIIQKNGRSFVIQAKDGTTDTVPGWQLAIVLHKDLKRYPQK